MWVSGQRPTFLNLGLRPVSLLCAYLKEEFSLRPLACFCPDRPRTVTLKLSLPFRRRPPPKMQARWGKKREPPARPLIVGGFRVGVREKGGRAAKD